MLRDRFRILNRIETRLFSTSSRKLGNKSFSQCGEDLIIKYVFGLRGILKPSYLDIGANDPYFLSNTALFYLNGCRGINVEANPALIGKFLTSRPDDINLNVGISGKESVLEFYIINDPTLSSFSKEECAKFTESGNYRIVKTLNIKVITINKVLDSHNRGVFPDYLSIDAEGMDFEILKSIDYVRNAPKVICVEASDYSPKGSGERRSELIDYLENNGYYEYANTNLNAIMVRKDFWFI